MASINKMSELLFFRSEIQAVIKEAFTPYQCCKTIYDYLVNGYEIQQLSQNAVQQYGIIYLLVISALVTAGRKACGYFCLIADSMILHKIT